MKGPKERAGSHLEASEQKELLCCHGSSLFSIRWVLVFRLLCKLAVMGRGVAGKTISGDVCPINSFFLFSTRYAEGVENFRLNFVKASQP